MFSTCFTHWLLIFLYVGCPSLLSKRQWHWRSCYCSKHFIITLLWSGPLCCCRFTSTVVWSHAALQWRKMWNAAICWIQHLSVSVSLCICIFEKHSGCDTFSINGQGTVKRSFLNVLFSTSSRHFWSGLYWQVICQTICSSSFFFPFRSF